MRPDSFAKANTVEPKPQSLTPDVSNFAGWKGLLPLNKVQGELHSDNNIIISC